MEVGIKGLIKKRKGFPLLERRSLIFSSVLPNFSPNKPGNVRITHTSRRVRASIIAVEKQYALHIVRYMIYLLTAVGLSPGGSITLHIYTKIYIYKKVKCSRYRPGVAQKVGRGIPLLFHDRGTRRG